MLHISVLSFSKWFKHISSISKPLWRTAHIWSVSEGNYALIIGLKISDKFSYRADNRKMGIYWPIPIWWAIYRASLLISAYLLIFLLNQCYVLLKLHENQASCTCDESLWDETLQEASVTPHTPADQSNSIMRRKWTRL